MPPGSLWQLAHRRTDGRAPTFTFTAKSAVHHLTDCPFTSSALLRAGACLDKLRPPKCMTANGLEPLVWMQPGQLGTFSHCLDTYFICLSLLICANLIDEFLGSPGFSVSSLAAKFACCPFPSDSLLFQLGRALCSVASASFWLDGSFSLARQ